MMETLPGRFAFRSPPSRGDLFEAGVLFSFLSLLFSWPLVLQFGSEIPRSMQPGDPVHILYGLITGARNLLEHPLRFFDATFFHPYPMALSFLDQIFGLCLLAAPVLKVTGNMIAAYNTVWLLTFVLSGMGAFALALTLTGNRAAGFLAGTLYAFHPLRFHSAGILHAVAMMWIPFALLCLHLYVVGRSRKYLILFAFFSVLQFLSSGYTGVFILFATLLYLVVLFMADRSMTLEFLRSERWALLLTFVVSLLVLAPLVAPAFRNLAAAVGLRRSLGEAALWSALPADYLTPSPESLFAPLSPTAARARHPLFPGAVSLLLAGAWVIRRGWRGEPFRHELLFYLALAGTSAVLALGPVFTVGDQPLPLPFSLLYYGFPGASLVRAPVRFMVLATLALSVLAGAGLARLLERGRDRRPVPGWTGLLVIGVALIELYPGPLTLFDPWGGGMPSAYDRFAGTSEPFVLAELPMAADETQETMEEARYQLYSLRHGKRLVNGVGAYVPQETRELRRVVQGFPDQASLDFLTRLGVTHVVIHTRLYRLPEMRALRYRIAAFPELQTLDEKDGIWVLALSSGTLEG